MTEQQQPFNPNNVPINYTLNFAQVNVLLLGMKKLPREQTEGFYEQFQAVALQTIQAAEHLHNNPPADDKKPDGNDADQGAGGTD